MSVQAYQELLNPFIPPAVFPAGFHVHCWSCTHTFSLLAIYCLPVPGCHYHLFFCSESIFLCNFTLGYVSSMRKHTITCVGCNTFSLLNVVAYSLQKLLKIIIGHKKIIFWVRLVFCCLVGEGFFLMLWFVWGFLFLCKFFLVDHKNSA